MDLIRTIARRPGTEGKPVEPGEILDVNCRSTSCDLKLPPLSGAESIETFSQEHGSKGISSHNTIESRPGVRVWPRDTHGSPIFCEKHS